MLKVDLQRRYRELVIQFCDVWEVEILNGVVRKDDVHLNIVTPHEYQ